LSQKVDTSNPRFSRVTFDLAIAEDSRQETRANRRTRVDRDNRSSAVGVTKEVMAALDPGDLEPGLLQGRDDLSARDPRKTLTPQ
jgi:hypothetical protein